MKVFTTTREVQQYLAELRSKGLSTGFVATMGALHHGHLSLIAQAKRANDIVICSIFVNPTQFNDPADLEKYPRPIAHDTQMLEQAGCDILFNPPVSELYADNEHWHLALGEIEHLLEGEFRPGHYQGVTQVVYKLFNIIKPDTAYFGQKDYQQFMVITKMVELLDLPVKLIMCPIIREEDGLAMSSRNIHLTVEDRLHSLILSKTLNWVKQNFDRNNIAGLQIKAADAINAEDGVSLEYFELTDADTLQPASPHTKSVVALVAARVGKTRLIDNVLMN
ncbi:pantoate--beta-alanine ligase [Mucilaginibacter sp. E4BP6]|uniref:pantoate--beta-alanine ligase n=1 Tax=Mucilaginibacter sp. E4BP6 TaxID=2723089 RepID=UPI0015CBD179|nr:pantoate--beta-alanine ligase [Mucilaginibacter sp. E4BP6]NYE68350.1 pantoate--beta-alanine ligase [Mucilaginibacter sp. E4BP6]